MNKTIYIKEDDIPIWDRARELRGREIVTRNHGELAEVRCREGGSGKRV